ncbi:hypothetical protein BJ322DRAFT_1083717 [Thelephora terrestris]|uniref:Uncharacterized protein n=1 Tax=Thelephora terrestris TaxID=56493 RepID=A0A9P6H874_9AGAM|nr:hypothetical protein BJ322DRAFT_1083717 [Thelephora terrestris]
MQSSPQLYPPSSSLSTFEFTKRKRWADLLITELTEAIILILSTQCQILYCSAAVKELLGWRDEDLIDTGFLDLVNVDDRENFKTVFEQSIRDNSDMQSYVRMHTKPEVPPPASSTSTPEAASRATEVLFEIIGYPHFVEGEGTCKCFFATAKTYPSRNTAMLNTFLELKMENERLQHRVRELRAQKAPFMQTLPSLTVPTSTSASLPSTFGAHPSSTTSSQLPIDPAPSTVSDHSESAMQTITNPVTRSLDAAGLQEGDQEEPAKKKTKKQIPPTSQRVCVTCGRTDSPEWRKGPLGPKTLCNACGLRWAKQARRFDDTGEGGGASTVV